MRKPQLQVLLRNFLPVPVKITGTNQPEKSINDRKEI